MNVSKPEEYMIPVGEADRKRLDALGAIFDSTSMKWLTSNCTPKNARILDVGCGNGCLTRLFAKTFQDSSVVGIDISPEQIGIAKKVAEEEKLTNTTWDVCDVYRLEDLKDKHRELFDIVHSRFVLTHLTDPAKAVDSMLSMVRPGGFLLVEEHGSLLRYEYKPTPVKAMEAWEKMLDFQRRLQQSHKDTADRVITHLSTRDNVSTYGSRLFQIPVEGQLKKSMYRMGAEHGLKKIQEMGKPELVQALGYEDGATWLKEMGEFESNDAISFVIKDYHCVVAEKRKME